MKHSISKAVALMLALIVLVGAMSNVTAFAASDSKYASITLSEENWGMLSQEELPDVVEGPLGMKFQITGTRFEYYKNSIGDYEYYGIIEVTNVGDTLLYLDTCSFDIEDSDGELITTDDMVSSVPAVIAPGEKGYYYNSLGMFESEMPIKTKLTLTAQLKVSIGNKQPTRYNTSSVKLSPDDWSEYKVTGRLENHTDEELSYVSINFIYYDKNGQVLAIDGTSLIDVPPQGKKSFESSSMFMSENVHLADIAEVVAVSEEMYFQW